MRVRDAQEAADMIRRGITWPTMADDLRRMVPRWHFEMLADHNRNGALLRAIAETVTPGQLVLDIGTGAGLTALAAARSGADVVTCEANPVVAELARRVILGSKFADRIRVLGLPSTKLEVGVHLDRAADVLVAEVFDADLFGEGAMRSISDAVQRLLQPEARLLPSRGEVLCQLVQSEGLYRLNRVGTINGFDLSAFNLAATGGVMYASTAGYHVTSLSRPATLFHLDFRKAADRGDVTVHVPVSRGGNLQAVVVWFQLELTEADWLGNSPHDGTSHWKQAVVVVDERWVEHGELVAVHASHDGARLSLELSYGGAL